MRRSLSDFAELAKQNEGRALSLHGAERLAREEALRKIRIRRFAGPEKYADLIGHLRVAHLTDLHVGRVTPMRVQHAAVELTNSERPDLVVITGDFVCHSLAYLDALEQVIAGFDAPVIAVLGNHDHWSGADEVRNALRRGGAEILDNRHTTITLHGEKLQVLGLDDSYTGNARRAEAVHGLRTDVATLGLSHIAEEADGLWRFGIPLVLSGHTHGGQVTFARLHELAIGKIAGHKYVHGLYGTRKRDTVPNGAVYVGAGIGAAVMPLRLGDRGQREITIFELGAAPGALEEHHEEQAPLAGRKPSAAVLAKRAAKVLAKRAKRERREKSNGGTPVPRSRKSTRPGPA